MKINQDLFPPPVDYAPRRSDSLFLWTVFLLLLVAFGLACWVATFYIFGHPEKAFSYKALIRLHKLQLPQRFSVSAAPNGEFINAEKLFQKVNSMNPEEFHDFNLQLIRNYLRNFEQTNLTVPYLMGRFTILDVYQLTPSDLFPSGVAALAVSVDEPKLLIEHIYTSTPGNAPLIKRNLQTGMDIDLRRTFDLSAVIAAEKLNDGRLELTVVPINYGSYGLKGTSSGFTLDPPTSLNLNARFPIFKDARREEADQAYLAYREKLGLGPLFDRHHKPKSVGAGGAGAGSATALTGLDMPTPPPEADATPAATAPATAAQATPGKDGKRPAGSPSPAVASVKHPSPAPKASPPAIAAAFPDGVHIPKAIPVQPAAPTPGLVKSVPTANGAGGTSLQPFLPPGSTTASTRAGGARPTWTTYPSGGSPAGRRLRVTDIASLGDHPVGSEPLYLVGHFVVRAAIGDKGAVLRPRDDTPGSNLGGSVRIMAEYPANHPIPNEGAEVDRDDQRPYQVTDVRRGGDGTYTVYVREIMEP